MSDRSQRRKLGQNYLIDPVILFEIEQAINPQENNLFFGMIKKIGIKPIKNLKNSTCPIG